MPSSHCPHNRRVSLEDRLLFCLPPCSRRTNFGRHKRSVQARVSLCDVTPRQLLGCAFGVGPGRKGFRSCLVRRDVSLSLTVWDPVIFPCEEDDPVRPHLERSGEEFWDTEWECAEEKARGLCVLRGAGAPAESEVEQHYATHTRFRSLCPALRVWRERPVTSIARK